MVLREPLYRSRLEHFVSDRRELLPPQTSEWCRPEYRVDFGDPFEKIVSAAGQTNADLIVMGIWEAGAFARATTHAGNTPLLRGLAGACAGAHRPRSQFRDPWP